MKQCWVPFHRRPKIVFILSTFITLAIASSSCSQATTRPIQRLDSIPSDAVKILAGNDDVPPLSLSNEYETPIPLPGDVNTAGGEDSPFITTDGNMLYFWFTPDVRLPAEKQLGDRVTGIYISCKGDGPGGFRNC